jgi:rare lipoprotein A
MTGQGLVELSPMAWAELGLSEESASPVRVRRVNPPEPERAMLRMGEQAPLRMDTPPGLLAALNRKLGSQPGYVPHERGKKVPAPLRAVQLPRTPAYHAAPSHPAPNPDEAAAAAAEAVAQARSVAPQTHSYPQPRRDAARAASGEHGAYVQVGAFSSRARAEGVARSVGGTVGAVGSLWLVRIGPLTGEGAAASALAKARRAGYADARILHVS